MNVSLTDNWDFLQRFRLLMNLFSGRNVPGIHATCTGCFKSFDRVVCQQIVQKWQMKEHKKRVLPLFVTLAVESSTI